MDNSWSCCFSLVNIKMCNTLNNQMNNDMGMMLERMRDSLHIQMSYGLLDQMYDKLDIQMRNQIRTQMCNQVFSQIVDVQNWRL